MYRNRIFKRAYNWFWTTNKKKEKYNRYKEK